MDQLFSVHQAISNAQFERDNKGPESITVAFRLTKDIKDQANQICTQHGITMSDFLRQCCEGLVHDYQGKQNVA